MGEPSLLFVVVQLPSCIPLLETPWTAAHQASLSTVSWSLLKFMSTEWWCHLTISSSAAPFSLSQHQGLFQWVGSLHQVAKILELQHQSFNEYSGFVSFKIDWFDLAIQGPLKSLLQHHNSEASILWHSAFFMVQLSIHGPTIHTWLLEKPQLWLCGACHSFPSKEQVSFNFMAIVTIYSDFRIQKNKIFHCFHFLPL